MEQLTELVRSALKAAAADDLVEKPDIAVDFERPRKREHGDWATNVALAAAGRGGNPRAVAEALVERLPQSELVDHVEVAGPGFLNFHLSPAWLHDVVRRAARPGSGFARSDVGSGTSNVEYVSANPTGPVNVVNGRHAAVGDAIANLLRATGHEVTREFYVNDAGRQVRLFAESLAARYLQQLGHDAVVSDDGYQGDYVVELARDIVAEVGDRYLDSHEDERVEAMFELGVARTLDQMRASLERFGSEFDVWFSERDLYDRKEVDAALSRLRDSGMVEERDGALWFLSSRFGDDKDRVVVRSNGEPTYLASDAAYLMDKFRRGFDHLIYLWGADHHGTIPRLLGAAEALGFDRRRVEIRIVQMVTISRGGEAVKASKRAGVLVPLDELVDEVGVDAARYTFLTRSIESHLDFDIELAKEQAPENPVYYVQYAHARICSILRRTDDLGTTLDVESAPLDRLGHPSEDALMRKLASYEEVVPEAARLRAPQRITRLVEELAATFSAFYRDCRVLSEDEDLSRARLALCVATKAVIADALGLLGVTAPERM
jgi:arginyl-tRNA synthetase